MRTGLVLSAGLLYCSTTAVAALAASPAPPPPPPPTEGGSIQALLERYSAKARHGVVPLNQHKSSSSTNQTVPLPGGQMPGGGGGGGGGGDGQLHSNDKRSPYVILPHPPRQPTAVWLDPSSPDVSLAQPSAGVVATASVDAQGMFHWFVTMRTAAAIVSLPLTSVSSRRAFDQAGETSGRSAPALVVGHSNRS